MQSSREPQPPLRVGYVPGVTLTKWRGVWAERFGRRPLEVIEVDQDDQRRVLDDGEVDLCFVRLPIELDGLHLIKLYEELPVAWVSKDHLLAAADDEVALADLADENVVTPITGFHLDLVAAGEGVLLVPQSVARSHSRRDFTYRIVTDAPSTTIGLAWLKANPHEMVEEFIGIVRGRTANSSRSTQERAAKKPPAPPAPARTAAKPARPVRGQRRGRR